MPNSVKPFLGETKDRKKAFPDFEEIELTIEQDKYEYYVYKDYQRIVRYNLEDIPRYLNCVNPDCYRGGLDLQSLIMWRKSGGHEFNVYCRGDEGTPKGRKKGNPCDNTFEVKLKIKKKK